ncbi:hypothetical protein [Hydrogenophaga atypica]|uniref:Uncharacterized protein n=1 Tax=Hydrogenophaga atypica TaxID=249409 RepID=A0ABW2QGB7_9BURK
MKKTFVALAATLVSTWALAHNCPNEMKAIDAKLPSVQLSAEAMGKVKDLRAKGEQLHKEGKHTESMAALAEAKKLLGM